MTDSLAALRKHVTYGRGPYTMSEDECDALMDYFDEVACERDTEAERVRELRGHLGALHDVIMSLRKPRSPRSKPRFGAASAASISWSMPPASSAAEPWSGRRSPIGSACWTSTSRPAFS